MSKRAFRKYLDELDDKALREQLLDLYERFAEVKVYYDFVFNPKEGELLGEAMERISEEYFPRRRKRAKARRSVAHRYIRHFRTLGVDPLILAELMAFNLETALRFEREKKCPQAFYKSMHKAFEEWGRHLVHHRLIREHRPRVEAYVTAVDDASWPNREMFDAFLEQLNT